MISSDTHKVWIVHPQTKIKSDISIRVEVDLKICYF